MRRAVVLGIGALASMCGACSPAQPRIVNAAPPIVYAQSIKALATHGFDCKIVKAQLMCDDDNPRRPTIFVSYLPAGSRFVIVAFDRIAEPCDALLSDINHFNYEFDFAQVSCRDDETPMLFYVGSVVVPEHGLTERDLGGYAAWWTNGLITALRMSNLVRRGPSPREPSDKRDSPPPSEPTLRKL